jgi:hypothetical protein
MNNGDKQMDERKELFFKELRELLAKHNAEFDRECRGHGYYTEDVTVVNFNGTAENGWNFETADLHQNV